jgi:hypothetical protein
MSNTGFVAGDGQHFTTWSLGKRMRAFDNLPSCVRVALANSARDWSVEQCHISLHGGDQARRIPSRSADELVELIAAKDAKLLKT